jgi:hypothetical protein
MMKHYGLIYFILYSFALILELYAVYIVTLDVSTPVLQLNTFIVLLGLCLGMGYLLMIYSDMVTAILMHEYDWN